MFDYIAAAVGTLTVAGMLYAGSIAHYNARLKGTDIKIKSVEDKVEVQLNAIKDCITSNTQDIKDLKYLVADFIGKLAYIRESVEDIRENLTGLGMRGKKQNKNLS